MRIVQLANFHSPTSGGLRVAVDTLRKGYRDAGHECVLIAPGPADAVRESVCTLRAPKLPNGSGYRMIVRRRAVLRLLEDLRPDSIEVHDKLLQQWIWVWSRTNRVPMLAMSHERLATSMPMLLPFAPDAMVRGASHAVARRTLEHCDVLVAGSHFAAAEFPLPTDVRVVPLGVDLETFAPDPRPAPHGPTRLVIVSRLSSEKRPELAVETLRSLIAQGLSATLTVIGDGPARPQVEQAALGLPVRFAGYLTGPAAVAGELRAADIAIVPGPAETFGLAAAEALACGTPIVTVAGAAPSELLGDQPAAGRAVPLDAAAFARAVVELLRIPPATRAGAARGQAEQFPWSRTTAAMRELHETGGIRPLRRCA